ncbi:MAG: hypothetical protein ACI9EP_000091 [Oceanospirillaceae bacterium]|jgi:hypothetical protein
MNRHDFHLKFGSKKSIVLPVIHVLDHEQTYQNISIAIDGGCPGVFLINHDFEKEKLLPIINSIRAEFSDYWIGINFLAVTGEFTFPILGALQSEGIRVDGYWADDACIDEHRAENDQIHAQSIDTVRKESGWQGLYIGGTAFKKQREVGPAEYAYSAQLASNHMDIVVTGLVSVVMEDNENTAKYREKYKCITAIQPNTKWQDQANAQYLESFKTYNPESAFPK